MKRIISIIIVAIICYVARLISETFLSGIIAGMLGISICAIIDVVWEIWED